LDVRVNDKIVETGPLEYLQRRSNLGNTRTGELRRRGWLIALSSAGGECEHSGTNRQETKKVHMLSLSDRRSH
jgi:hypothetical protein